MSENNNKPNISQRFLKFAESLQKPRPLKKKPATSVIYGDISNRMFALIIDMLILMPLAFLVPHALKTKFSDDASRVVFINAYQYVLIGIYSIFFIYKYGATPGKMILGLRVVDNITGGKLTLSQSIIRYLAYFTAPIGLISGSLKKNRRCFHDYIADTVVIYSPNRWYKRHVDKIRKRIREYFNLPAQDE